MRPDELMGPKFLLYHDVVAAAGGDETKAAENFRRHFATIAEAGYRFVPVADFVAGKPLTRRDAIVTVDDGARSFKTCMLPVLREYGVKATLFIVTSFVGKPGRGVDFMSWDELDELAAEGHHIGCHTVSHIPLDEVDDERQRFEIETSTAEFRDRGFEQTVFAYPFGRYNDVTKRLLVEQGYDCAVTVMKGGFDRFEIRRHLFTGLENAALTRVILSDRYFDTREAIRKPLPRAILRQDNPIPPDRWGAPFFGVEND